MLDLYTPVARKGNYILDTAQADFLLHKYYSELVTILHDSRPEIEGWLP
jgi:hypothetical protein